MAILMIINVISSVTEIGFEVAMLSFLAIILIPPMAIKKFKPDQTNLAQLIPTSFFTFIIPVFGAAFGGPDMGPEWLVLIPLAAVGGAFWSLPFAGWNYWKRDGNDTDAQE
tara:strand:- start:104 stop:436 length:333 start_codon:yes stop_codon:yes gene_type:complete